MVPEPLPSSTTILEGLISSHTNTTKASIPPNTSLADLGLESIAAVQLADELLSRFNLEVHPDELFGITLAELNQHLPPGFKSAPAEDVNDSSLRPTPTAQTHIVEQDSIRKLQQEGEHPPDPFSILKQSDAYFSVAAQKRGFHDYSDAIAPLQNDTLQAYITEGFRGLGVDLSGYPHGTKIPPVPHLAKYGRLMKRLLNFLESRYIITQRSDKVLRGSDPIDVNDSSQLLQNLRTEHPHYECEAKLMDLIGPKLADCLSGKTDPVKILFGSAASLDIMEDFYAHSPMMSALTDQLITFLVSYLRSAGFSNDHPVRILEVGAGTGGTAARLVEALDEAAIPVQYTFTDVGSSFVTKAEARFRKNYPWMRFETLNIEQEIPRHYMNNHDITLGANVVHATSDRVATCRRLRETLRPGGFVVLSEITRVIHWYDICFGLLDGWWRADGGKGYPIQPAEVWMEAFRRAGFRGVGFSTGESEEAKSQQLLVGCDRECEVSFPRVS